MYQIKDIVRDNKYQKVKYVTKIKTFPPCIPFRSKPDSSSNLVLKEEVGIYFVHSTSVRTYGTMSSEVSLMQPSKRGVASNHKPLHEKLQPLMESWLINVLPLKMRGAFHRMQQTINRLNCEFLNFSVSQTSSSWSLCYPKICF